MKLTSSVSKNDRFALEYVESFSVRRQLKFVNKLVVSEIPDTPRLGVNPFLKPPFNCAVSQSLVMVMLVLFATRGPLSPVLSDNPVLAARERVGVSCML